MTRVFKAHKDSPTTKAGPARKRNHGKSILFVDDHDVLLRLSCEILEMLGYRTVGANSAAEALEKFEHDQIDLLVTDFRMEGMDGLELARAVHAKNPQTPIIMITGYGPMDDPGHEVNLCLAKEELFPALPNHIKRLLAETANTPSQASPR